MATATAPTFTAPTHSVTIILVNQVTGKKVRYVKNKVSDTTPEGCLAFFKRLAPVIVGNQTAADIEVTDIKKIPVAKKSVKLTENHDYVMLTAIWPEGRINVTTARYRESLSGTLAGSPAAKAFFRKFCAVTAPSAGLNGHKTVGEFMKSLEVKAKAATTADEFFTTAL